MLVIHSLKHSLDTDISNVNFLQGNGKEEVVCCSWDGQIYIVNHSKEVVRYHFEENVAGFTAGQSVNCKLLRT